LAADEPPFTLDPDTFTVVSRTERLRLDLGAVGKGYALDRGAELLREWNIRSACLISGGSTVLALEPAQDSRAWGVGLGEEESYRTIAFGRHLTERIWHRGRRTASHRSADRPTGTSHAADPATRTS
jgi:thiamine biosynthesis lipoprotein ApbE